MLDSDPVTVLDADPVAVPDAWLLVEELVVFVNANSTLEFAFPVVIWFLRSVVWLTNVPFHWHIATYSKFQGLSRRRKQNRHSRQSHRTAESNLGRSLS